MYAKTICPYCRKHSVHSITVQGHASIDISIDETVTAEEFLLTVQGKASYSRFLFRYINKKLLQVRFRPAGQLKK